MSKNELLKKAIAFVETECKDAEVAEAAIDVLRRNIARMPDFQHMQPYDDYWEGVCPVCEHPFEYHEIGDTLFCSNCGQKFNVKKLLP